MKSLDIRTIQPWLNQTQSIWLPDFSEILDMSFDEWGANINILYQYSYELAGTNQKMFNIWIIDSNNIMSPPSDFYNFFGSVEKRQIEINLANANNGRIIPMDIITKYYIFIEEIKTVAENRDDKLEKVLHE
jgi:hypothetical protein